MSSHRATSEGRGYHGGPALFSFSCSLLVEIPLTFILYVWYNLVGCLNHRPGSGTRSEITFGDPHGP